MSPITLPDRGYGKIEFLDNEILEQLEHSLSFTEVVDKIRPMAGFLISYPYGTNHQTLFLYNDILYFSSTF